MAKADILFDKTEFILRVADKQAMTMNIRADQITTISIQPTMVRKLFKQVESEVMVIKMKGGPGPAGQGMPISKESLENKQKGSWEAAKKSMIKFAKDNNITLHEDHELWTPPEDSRM